MSAARLLIVVLCAVLSSATPVHAEVRWNLSIDVSSHTNVARLDRQIAAARALGKPVMIDLFAQWCAACRMLDHGALSDPTVVRELDRFVTIRIDVSDQNEVASAIGARFGATVLPTIQLISSTGKTIQVAGTRPAGELAAVLKKVR